LQARAGGERFQREPGGLPRSLKKQYQSANVPEHERVGPLLWAAGRLLFVPGLGIDARSRAAAGEPQLALRWCPERIAPADTQIVSQLDS
jgi:tRNA(Ile)-lysidine synthase